MICTIKNPEAGEQRDKSKFVHVMLDLETMGREPWCVVLGIGACAALEVNGGFIKLEVREFSERIGRGKDKLKGIPLIEEPETLAWWENLRKTPEGAATYNLYNRSGGTTTRHAIQKFSHWLNHVREASADFCHTPVDLFIYGNSASVDLKILERVYKLAGVTLPWNYREEMCFRTIANLYPWLRTYRETCTHNALSDAQDQMSDLVEMLSYCRGVV